MDAKIFERLISSIKEVKGIIAGQKKPSRKFFIGYKPTNGFFSLCDLKIA